jgi:hypothetical protein
MIELKFSTFFYQTIKTPFKEKDKGLAKYKFKIHTNIFRQLYYKNDSFSVESSILKTL